MILSGNQAVDSLLYNQMVQDAQDRLMNAQPLLFYDRIPRVNADDGEITATFTGRVYAADIIADDQEAVVYSGGKLEFVTNSIPNIKIGTPLPQSYIARLGRLTRSQAGPGEAGIFQGWKQRTVENQITGVRQTINALLCAMLLDSFDYNRLGVKLAGASWGMPGDLKATPSKAWTDTTSTPITDILTMVDFAATKYGETFNRVTLSRAQLANIFKTDEFKAFSSGYFKVNLTGVATNVYLNENRTILSNILNGMIIETHDTQIARVTGPNTVTTDRVQPANKVLLTSTSDDGSSSGYDFANAIVTESTVSSLVGGFDLGGEQFGPIGYWEGRLNPPDLTAWSVARGFPRKHRPTASAVLTVG